VGTSRTPKRGGEGEKGAKGRAERETRQILLFVSEQEEEEASADLRAELVHQHIAEEGLLSGFPRVGGL